MKKSLPAIVLSAYLIALSFICYSQTGGVSINQSNIPAHPSAMLDVSSTSAPYLGMLIPRMSTANRNSIVAPATGLQIFNTDCGVNEYYTGTCWIAMNQVIKSPLHITCSGTTDFCANETRTLTILPVTGATNYDWLVPAGATITSGQGTTSVTVAFGNNSGQVCVRAENACEMSPSTCIDIHINPVPPEPNAITGPLIVVPGNSYSYFINGVGGAGVYNWIVPPGITITSGIGTTIITVSVTCSAVSGNISVAAQNNCGTGNAQTLSITVASVLASAGPAISSSPGTIGGSPTASGGTSPYIYAWVPSTALSSTTVANPTTTVCSLTTYTVTVTDANGCTSSSSTTASFTQASIASPTEGTHVSSSIEIVWNWNSVNGATGYKYNTISDYNTATDIGNTTTYTQTGLACNTAYTLYVWSYDACLNSAPAVLSSSTASSCFFAATGGSVTTDGNYKIHTFTSNGTFVVTSGGNAEVLVVAGGGGGGNNNGGGGGAGGLIHNTSYTVNAGTYPVTVGAGGARSSDNGNSGNPGQNSVFSTLTAIGGGAGCGGQSGSATSGGSGGGLARNRGTPGSGTPGQGNDGATNPINSVGGGGGGAGAAGSDKNGGIGRSISITGSSVYYAGGGGGGTENGTPGGQGGQGGGGNGGSNNGSGVNGYDGTNGLGGGGGGEASGGGGTYGGSGGSGVVIIRYLFQ